MAIKNWQKRPRQNVWWNSKKLEMVSIAYKRNIKKFIVGSHTPQKGIQIAVTNSLTSAKKIAMRYMQKN